MNKKNQLKTSGGVLGHRKECLKMRDERTESRQELPNQKVKSLKIRNSRWGQMISQESSGPESKQCFCSPPSHPVCPAWSSFVELIKTASTFHCSLDSPALFGFPCASLTAQLVKKPPAKQKTPVRLLGRENLLEKGWATHSSIPGLPWWLSW